MQARVSPVAKDLIARLLCDAEHRIGSHGGAAEIKVRPCSSCSSGGGHAVWRASGLTGGQPGCRAAFGGASLHAAAGHNDVVR